MGEYGVGQSVPREEDPYLLRGAGRYVDDMAQVGLLRAFVLRSPHAHARIRSIDVSAARSMPGVVLALAGDDPAVAGSAPRSPTRRASAATARPPSPAPSPLSPGTRCGISASRRLRGRRDAAPSQGCAEAIAIDYDMLPAVATLDDAIKPGAAPSTTNARTTSPSCTRPATSGGHAAFASAFHVVKHRMVINRLTTNAMERAARSPTTTPATSA